MNPAATPNLYPVSLRMAIDAVVEVPGSKSIANRALVLASLASGRSVLTNVPDGDDTVALIESLRTLGVGIEWDDGVCVVNGPLDFADKSTRTVNAHLAGTTSRFLMALAATRAGSTTITGEGPLRTRPNMDLKQALVDIGAQVNGTSADGLPVVVSGANIKGGVIEISGSSSSQFITALMLIGAHLRDGISIQIDGDLVSRSYILMTAQVLKAFGVDAQIQEAEIRIGTQPIISSDLFIEPDASSASYPLAAAAIVGGRATVKGLGAQSLQGDSVFVNLLAQMGCDGAVSEDTTVIRDLRSPLQGIDLDMKDCSDLVPTMAVVCCFARSPSRIRGVEFIRRKESDRLGDLAGELCKMGADVEVLNDGLLIKPAQLHGAELFTHHDHRLAMALALAGLTVPGVTIREPDVVAKSWPQYWKMLERL